MRAIFLFVVFVLAVAIVTGLQSAIPISTILQHLIIPYSLDIRRGVGAEAAMAFRFIVAANQLLIIGLAYWATRASHPSTRILLNASGILFASVYFTIVLFGFIMPRFH